MFSAFQPFLRTNMNSSSSVPNNSLYIEPSDDLNIASFSWLKMFAISKYTPSATYYWLRDNYRWIYLIIIFHKIHNYFDHWGA